MTAWRAEDRPVERIEAIDLAELARRLDGERRPTGRSTCATPPSTAEGHIPGSIHIPFAELRDRLDELPRERPIATICKAGKRSGLAASILQREGFEGVIHVSRGNAAHWADGPRS